MSTDACFCIVGAGDGASSAAMLKGDHVMTSLRTSLEHVPDRPTPRNVYDRTSMCILTEQIGCINAQSTDFLLAFSSSKRKAGNN